MYMRIMRSITFACLLLLGLSACGSDGEAESLRLVSWNVQTFFDAERDGCEYKDFVTDKRWGEAAYRERLKRLCSSLAELDADVLVLEEIENEAVLQDISNFLCSVWMPGKRYRQAAFCKEAGGSLGCAVLSRYPLEGLSSQGLEARAVSGKSSFRKNPPLRPLMSVRVVKNGKSLILLVNHWKSMSGGEAESEVWREAQEGMLARSLESLEGRPVLACGDFNRDIRDFAGGDGGLIVLRSGDKGTPVQSPWFAGDGGLVEPGSYHYKEEWSRIDGFLYSGGLVLEDFRPETDGPWCQKDDKIPKKYKVWSGWGYSDHLPISCTVRF